MTIADQLTAAAWWQQFPLVVCAAVRLVMLAYADRITDGPRRRLFDRYPPESTYIGYLFTCPWCVGVWIGGAVAAAWLLWSSFVVVCAVGSVMWLASLGAALVDGDN